MAEGKKSFIAYSNWKDTFDALPDADAGKLIKHIFAYVNDEDPISESVLINAVFANIRSTLKRDLERWSSQIEQRSAAGKRSAEVRSTKSNDRSTTVNETQRNSTVNVNDNVLLEKETKRFLKPSILELHQHMVVEKSFSIPEATKIANDFFNHYESNGWKVGKNAMKNWKAALTNWISRADNFKTKNNGPKKSTEDAIREWQSQ